MQHCRVKTADTYLLRGLQRNADGSLRWPLPCKQGTTNVESSILIDAVNAVNLNVEHFLQLAMHYKIYNDPPRAPAVLFRDFAFPPHVDAHYARYPVPRNGSSAPSASAVLASSVASTSALPRVRALYDVPAVDESELLLNVGDVVEVIHEREDGWMIGMLNGISGLLPRSHVEYISEAKTDVIAAGNK